MNPSVFRYEPGYRWLVGDPASLTPTERVGQMCSWGVMQVMGGVARGYGFLEPFPRLCEAIVGLNYGCKHLMHYYTQYQDWTTAIACYNAGSPRVNDQGQYINQSYVDSVTSLWKGFEATEAV